MSITPITAAGTPEIPIDLTRFTQTPDLCEGVLIAQIDSRVTVHITSNVSLAKFPKTTTISLLAFQTLKETVATYPLTHYCSGTNILLHETLRTIENLQDTINKPMSLDVPKGLALNLNELIRTLSLWSLRCVAYSLESQKNLAKFIENEALIFGDLERTYATHAHSIYALSNLKNNIAATPLTIAPPPTHLSPAAKLRIQANREPHLKDAITKQNRLITLLAVMIELITTDDGMSWLVDALPSKIFRNCLYPTPDFLKLYLADFTRLTKSRYTHLGGGLIPNKDFFNSFEKTLALLHSDSSFDHMRSLFIVVFEHKKALRNSPCLKLQNLRDFIIANPETPLPDIIARIISIKNFPTIGTELIKTHQHALTNLQLTFSDIVNKLVFTTNIPLCFCDILFSDYIRKGFPFSSSNLMNLTTLLHLWKIWNPKEPIDVEGLSPGAKTLLRSMHAFQTEFTTRELLRLVGTFTNQASSLLDKTGTTSSHIFFTDMYSLICESSIGFYISRMYTDYLLKTQLPNWISTLKQIHKKNPSEALHIVQFIQENHWLERIDLSIQILAGFHQLLFCTPISLLDIYAELNDAIKPKQSPARKKITAETAPIEECSPSSVEDEIFTLFEKAPPETAPAVQALPEEATTNDESKSEPIEKPKKTQAKKTESIPCENTTLVQNLLGFQGRKLRDVLSYLTTIGATLKRQKGSHMAYTLNGHTIIIPHHPEIAIGTLKSIESQLKSAMSATGAAAGHA